MRKHLLNWIIWMLRNNTWPSVNLYLHSVTNTHISVGYCSTLYCCDCILEIFYTLPSVSDRAMKWSSRPVNKKTPVEGILAATSRTSGHNNQQFNNLRGSFATNAEVILNRENRDTGRGGTISMMLCFPLKKNKKAELALLFPLSWLFEQRSARFRIMLTDVSVFSFPFQTFWFLRVVCFADCCESCIRPGL